MWGFRCQTNNLYLYLVLDPGNEGLTVCCVNADWSDGAAVISRTGCTDTAGGRYHNIWHPCRRLGGYNRSPCRKSGIRALGLGIPKFVCSQHLVK